jgi:hypothetical protein
MSRRIIWECQVHTTCEPQPHCKDFFDEVTGRCVYLRMGAIIDTKEA